MTPPSKYILNTLGCKVDDLELKINILTYKLQYGTWPLPHQIPNPTLKKQLRNLRLTLSTSNDRNAWIKHMLLNSTSKTYLSSSKLDSTSVHRDNRMTELFDTKTGYVSSEIKGNDVSLKDHNNIVKSLKTISVESMKKPNLEGSHNHHYNHHQLSGLSKSENLCESCRVATELSLLPRKNSDYYSINTRKKKYPRYGTSRLKITNACDKYTESIEECKRFLRELQANARNASRRCEIIGQVNGPPSTIIKVKLDENNPKTLMDISKNVLQIDKIKNNCMLPSLNLTIRDNDLSKMNNIRRNILFCKNDDAIEISQETLNQIKSKLEILENVLRNYGVLDSSSSSVKNIKEPKEQKSNDVGTSYQNVVDNHNEMKNTIENIDEIKSKNFDLNVNPKEFKDKILQTTSNSNSSNSSDLELFESIDSENSTTLSMKSFSERLIDDNSSFNSTTITEDKINQRTTDEEETFGSSEFNQDYSIIEPKLILTRNNFQNDKEIKKKESFEVCVGMETTDENPSSISSTNSNHQQELEISKDRDTENESTEMLIQEALKCKKELLSRVELQKFYSNIEIRNEKEEETILNNLKDVKVGTLLETEKTTLQSKFLDIIAEESNSNCTDKTSGTYIFLQMNPSNEVSVHSSSSLNTNTNNNNNNNKEENMIINDNVVSEININDIVLPKSVNNNMENNMQLLKDIRKNDTNDYADNKIEEMIVETDDLLSSSCGNSLKYQLMIDNGSMTNLFSPDETNIKNKRCSSSVIKKDDILYNQDLSLKRRPGMLSFGKLKMNTVLSDENDLFRNPYFLAETTLSEVTCCEKGIEFNLIPISVSIDTHESNIFAMRHQNIFNDLKNEVVSSSPLRISFNNDRENRKVTEINENETHESDLNEIRIIQEDDQGNIICISEHATSAADTAASIVDCKNDDNYNVQEMTILNELKQLDMVISKHNVISQQSSIYFTGDNSSSINKITDSDSYQESLSNFQFNDCIQYIDIQNDILESCLDSCINLLKKKDKTSMNNNNNDDVDNNNESLLLEDVNHPSSECISNNNDVNNNNTTSVSYVQKNDKQLSNEECNINLLENKSEGFIFDGSIKYKKPSCCLEEPSNLKRNLHTSYPNYSKKSNTKTTRTNNDTKSKEPINIMERMTYSKRYSANNNNNNININNSNNNNQLKAKSNLSIIIDNKDNLSSSDCSVKSYTARQNNSYLSREKSRFNANNTNQNNFSSRSAVFSRSNNDRSKDEQQRQRKDKNKYKSETRSKCNTILTPKSLSKSCIPVLKSRLDSRKTTENIFSRGKSPIRGPLTMRGLYSNQIHTNDDNIDEINVIPTEGNYLNKEETKQHLDTMIEKQLKTESSSSSSSSLFKEEEKVKVIGEDSNNIGPHEQTIIYVNIINHNDCNVTRILNPEKFLEYTKQELIARNCVDESSDPKFQDNVMASSSSSSPFVIMTKEKNTLPKLVTILSSITNEVTDTDSNDNHKSLSNLNIPSGTLKSFWSLTIQQKEMEVSVKPSVTDTGTSMSDFLKIKETMPFNEHQIFGIPKELTNEEYSYLFEILTRKQNLGHLKEIQNLCNRIPKLRNNHLE
ncbi:hypothetical protein M0802_001755 [Mischocyttarus mexicanus]|nr:hypothetical protein M0802_001755 [Mischocyttarus mexicanus]